MTYHLDFTDKATEDISRHKKAGNKAILKKLLVLLEEIPENEKYFVSAILLTPIPK